MEKFIVNPVQVRMDESEKGSIYQSIIAMGFRARQINDQIKMEINERLADVITTNDETEGTNFDQIAISREFDRLAKPTYMAMKEISDGKLTFILPEKEAEED
ncbi:MAG: polymerase Rpb6 [Ignavibacteria bacterium]|nr:polymerase Rpb6 [Ignavibacteria bacterium]